MRPPGTLSVNKLQVLLAVIEAGSPPERSGGALGRATSAISYAIDTLEVQLGVPLFVRRTTGRPKTFRGRRVSRFRGQGGRSQRTEKQSVIGT
jgi:DNA-binding transcriptional LysR family regulator